MYRDNLEALQQRVRELDRALAARPLPPPPATTPFPWKRLRTMLTWLGVGLLLLGLGIDRLVENAQLLGKFHQIEERMAKPRQAMPISYQLLPAHSDSAGDCSILLLPPCRAVVSCDGKVLYRGAGSCAGGRYVDPADSWLDGTPQCVVDVARKRAMVRDISCHRKSGDDYPTLWQVDLELP